MTRRRKLLPSRLELHQQMDSRFAILRKDGISTLGDLMRKLATPSKREAVASGTCLPVNYLVLLRREAGSYLARPFTLTNFPGIPYEYTEVLKSKGLVNTKAFFEQVQCEEQKREVTRQTGIPLARIRELHALCDLSRITGVGGVFARVVYESGIRSVREFALAQASEHHRLYRVVTDTYGYKAGSISEEDIRYCIEYAKVVAESDNEAED